MKKPATGRSCASCRTIHLRRSWPANVKIETVYDRTELVDHVKRTVKNNLFEGGLLVIAVLFLFLGTFSMFIFTKTDQTKPTPRKLIRNKVYRICGWLIYGAVFFAIVLLHIGMFWLLNSGLSHQLVEVVLGPIETRMIEEAPKTDEPPPPPPPKIETPPPFVPPPRPAKIDAQL